MDHQYLRLFHGEVSLILDIPQRRLLLWAEKGLIVPSTDAAGRGSKRKYDYFDLLEAALVQELFEFGIGIHIIKKILGDLRKRGEIKKWVEGFRTLEYVRSVISGNKASFREIKKNPELKEIVDWFEAKGAEAAKKLVAKPDLGVLICGVKREEWKCEILVSDLNTTDNVQINNETQEYLSKFGKYFIVDLLAIKKWVDQRLPKP